MINVLKNKELLFVNQVKTDPRIIRTRKLIMDTFVDLSGKKESKDITVKAITEEAMINRATFYYHFEDIYDLLEKTLYELLLIDLNFATYENKTLNKETFTSIFAAIAKFQKSLSNRCHRGYKDTIARIIKEQLEVILYKLLLKQHPAENKKVLEVTSVMLAWGLYGASVEWRRNHPSVAPEEYIHSTIPYIMSGITLRTNH